MSSTRRRLEEALLGASILASACGAPTDSGTPPPPPADSSNFLPGPKFVTMLGELGTDLTFNQPCAPLNAAPATALIQTRVDLEPQNADWVARSLTSADGSLVIKLHVDSGDTPTDRRVSGQFSGTAFDLLGSGKRVDFDTLAVLGSGTGGEKIGAGIVGFAYGGVTFTNSSGSTNVCDAIFWTMVPLPASLDRAR